jgi:hypothetical protein
VATATPERLGGEPIRLGTAGGDAVFRTPLAELRQAWDR